ncbi:MAG: hypothetical protein ACR2IF_15895 [Terriglobales bacterium]
MADVGAGGTADTQSVNSAIRKSVNAVAVFPAFSNSITEMKPASIAAPDPAAAGVNSRYQHIWLSGMNTRCTIFWHLLVDELHSIENKGDKLPPETLDFKSGWSKSTLVL